MKAKLWAAAVASAAVVGALNTSAAAQQNASDGKPIELEIGASQPGEVFHCALPVTVHYAGKPALTKLTAVATVQDNGNELASTGIKTVDRPLISRVDADGIEYLAIPLQFELDKRSCENFTGLRIDFASCTFEDGASAACLSRLQLHRDSTIEADFAVGTHEQPKG